MQRLTLETEIIGWEAEMTPVQFEKISIVRLENGEIIGFHNDNLEVAKLSEELWHAVLEKRSGEELSELRHWSDSINTNVVRSSSEQKVKTVTINTTQLCNLRCTYCAAGGDGSYGSPLVKIDLEKSLPQISWFISRCLPGERFQINFLGGEPLLYPDVIRSIIEESKKKAELAEIALRFAVVTNGTRLHDPKVRDVLTEHRIAVTVSVDGPPEVQDKFRPKSSGGGSAEDLENGLRALAELKNKLPSIGLAAVFHKEYTEVLRTYEYFRRWNFDYYELNFSHTEFDAEASNEFCAGISQVAARAHQLGGEDELRKIRTFDGIFQRLDEQVQLENFCGSGKSLLSIDAMGDIFACPWDINEKSLKLNGGGGAKDLKLEGYTAPQSEKNPCKACWAKNICGGGCNYTHKKSTGTSSKVDPIFCSRTQSLLLVALEYYEKYRRTSDETH